MSDRGSTSAQAAANGHAEIDPADLRAAQERLVDLGILAAEVARLRAHIERVDRQLADVALEVDGLREECGVYAGLVAAQPSARRARRGATKAAASLSDAEALRLLRRSALFNGSWYLRCNPDVAVAGLKPAVHYLHYGWLEGREPGPAFSGKAYLAAHPQAAESGLNPLVHYLAIGRASGLALPPSGQVESGDGVARD